MSDNQHTMFDDVNHSDIIAHLCDSSADIKDRWPHIIAEIIDLIRAAQLSKGATKDQANEEAFELTQLICKKFGGMQLYIPKGEQLDRAVRDNKIWNDLKGDNIPELMHKYNLTQARIYQIIKEQKQLHTKTNQYNLFK